MMLALPAPNPDERITLCAHAWAWVDGEDYQEYADDQSGERVDGWCVYVRLDRDKHHSFPFDCANEVDFPTERAAEQHLETLQRAFPAAEVQWY